MAESTRYVPVQGTGSWAEIPLKVRGLVAPLWWQDRSPLDNFLTSRDCWHLNDAQPYIWNTSTGGLEVWWRWFRRKPTHPDHRDWSTAGHQLRLYFELQQTAAVDRVALAHSHGMQVVLYACAQGLELDRLVTFGGPVREDMSEVAEMARERIGQWLSVADPDDETQVKGEWFDGSLKVARCHPLADYRDLVTGIGHSGVLKDPACFRYWDELNWTHFLRENFKTGDWSMNGEAIIVVSGAVVALVQLIKWAGLNDKLGPVAVLLLSLMGVAFWGYGKGTFERATSFEYFAGWIAVSTGAAGVFGFTRAGSSAVTAMKAPPSDGAGSSRTIKDS